MSRRPVKVRREIPSDIRYNSVLVQRFINKINYQGKKKI
jgi:ribosomal protein S7